MNATRSVSCLFLLMALSSSIYAQEKKDTANIYHKLHNKAEKHKVTRWVYESLFEDPDEVEQDAPPVVIPKNNVNPFLKYKGAIVRDISIVVLDPFGYSVNNTWGKRPDYLERLGNKYHVTTKERIIQNTVLFRKNQELDPLELSESERLLRLSPYINDARIYVERIRTRKSDSVDIMILVQDKWSTTVGSNLDLNAPNVKFIEKNIFGIGHQFEEGVTWSNTDQYVTTEGRYSIFNIRNTFISSAVFYSTSKENRQFGASLDRPFYSPLAKWAGGAAVTRNYSVFKQTDIETGQVTNLPLNYNVQDFWAAKSFPVSAKRLASIDKRSSNFIIGARYYHSEFFERPSFDIDTNRFNRDQTMYLANFGFNRRTYYRDRYLYRFGANEDIPEGFSAELVQGTLKKEFSSQWYYSGIKLASGKHFDKIGYLSGGIGYGTFYDKSFISSGVVSLDAFYFSDLIKKGQWFFRQFTRYKVVNGIDRESFESININGTQMYGFSSDALAAKSKMILNLEFVMYAPYKVIGFRFAPVLLVGFATLGNNPQQLLNSQVYQAYALGLLIRNEYLIGNTFEVSIGLYPYMPGYSDYTLKTNPFNSYSVRARDYFISKPDLVAYE